MFRFLALARPVILVGGIFAAMLAFDYRQRLK